MPPSRSEYAAPQVPGWPQGPPSGYGAPPGRGHPSMGMPGQFRHPAPGFPAYPPLPHQMSGPMGYPHAPPMHPMAAQGMQQQYRLPPPTHAPRGRGNPSSVMKHKYDAMMQSPPPFPALAVRRELDPKEQEAVQLAQGRSHWGIAEAPPAGKSEENAEWQAMQPGEARVFQGYGPEEGKASTVKARALMDTYDRVMSRPTPGQGHDPRAEVPCKFWSSGRFCSNGDSCPFSHAGRRGAGGFFFQKADPRSRVPCTFHAQGRCLRGLDCPFSHRDTTTQQQPRPQHDERPSGQFAPPEGSNFQGIMPPQD
eukprot:Hpha_TRINITY_DN15173_c2_g10::TRINITY_DN15173_c2_g10_i1::g.129161::m.129161